MIIKNLSCSNLIPPLLISFMGDKSTRIVSVANTRVETYLTNLKNWHFWTIFFTFILHLIIKFLAVLFFIISSIFFMFFYLLFIFSYSMFFIVSGFIYALLSTFIFIKVNFLVFSLSIEHYLTAFPIIYFCFSDLNFTHEFYFVKLIG
jgi:hypothetical protein